MRGRVAGIGECMIELKAAAPGALSIGYAGDSFNSAVYFARIGARHGVSVDYVTALGDDHHSDAILALAAGEGVGTAMVERLPGRLPGLYMIETDAAGERRFLYWRSAAAARDMLRGDRGDVLAASLDGFAMIFATGISFSILDAPQREALFALLAACRAKGTKIVFDGNFRPRGWPDRDEARAVFSRALTLADIALPTLEDEQALFADADAAATIARFRAAGVAEIVVKRGPSGCVIAQGESVVESPTEARAALDTTGAGDSFNAAYLAARLLGREPAAAADAGHRLAGTVIAHRGAIIPVAAMPDLGL